MCCWKFYIKNILNKRVLQVLCEADNIEYDILNATYIAVLHSCGKTKKKQKFENKVCIKIFLSVWYYMNYYTSMMHK